MCIYIYIYIYIYTNNEKGWDRSARRLRIWIRKKTWFFKEAIIAFVKEMLLSLFSRFPLRGESGFSDSGGGTPRSKGSFPEVGRRLVCGSTAGGFNGGGSVGSALCTYVVRR